MGNLTRRLVLLLTVALVAAPLAGCLGGEEPTPPTTDDGNGGTPTEPTEPTSPTTPTDDGPDGDGDSVTPDWEIAATAFVEQSGPSANGVMGVGHLNDDDEYDVYVGGTSGGKLLLGQAGTGFEDATASAGVACEGCAITAVAIGDLNEDAANDLLVLTADGLHAYLNSGGVFVDAAAERGLADAGGDAVAVADVDNDGDLDVAVASGSGLSVYSNDGRGVFSAPDVVEGAAGSAFAFIFLDDDALLDLVVATADGVQVYQNQEGVFTDVTSSAGMPAGFVATTLVPFDFDNDQSMDLLLAGDDGVKLLKNKRTKAFQDVTATFGIPSAAASAAVPLDHDNDGWLDVLVVASGGSRLFRNELGESFAEVAQSGLGSGGFHAVGVADFDRDGRLDVLGLQQSGASRMFLNRADAGPFFTLHLRGNESNYSGVGVKVTLSSGTFIMFRQTGGVGSPTVATPIDPHFGIGKELVDTYTLAIKWPSGILQFENIKQDRVVNRQLDARESASEAPWAEC